MSTRGATPPRHMMRSIITKSQLEVCGAPTRMPLRGTSPTAVHRVAHSTNLASRLRITFLSRTRRGGRVLRHHGTGARGTAADPATSGRGARRLAAVPDGVRSGTGEEEDGRGREEVAVPTDLERPPRLPPRWFIRLFWQLHRAVCPRHRWPARPVAPHEAAGAPCG